MIADVDAPRLERSAEDRLLRHEPALTSQWWAATIHRPIHLSLHELDHDRSRIHLWTPRTSHSVTPDDRGDAGTADARPTSPGRTTTELDLGR